ncbi:E3 SUMO-protein ligase ZBED1 [Nilaparvata lugens]|uniref:E3 SUMO-protein ligase ZBED1 n=1 Tax=Nilaparvata lugens TaxID=108931 RepID=UPI00193DCC06|nr:E3 SUMO-protein ligase ZBED1 [Nilaparvata lugens]
MVKEKETLIYDKLVVPSSMRSIYWKGYGFPADAQGEIIDKEKLVCTICKSVIKYNRNTSNLRAHLVNKHIEYVRKLEEGQPPAPSPSSSKATDKPKKKNYKKKIPVNRVMFCADAILDSSNAAEKTSIQKFFEMEEHEQSTNEGEIPALEVDIAESSSVSEVTYLLNSTLDTEIGKDKVGNAVIDFIISDLQLPDILEAVGFQRMLASLHSPCLIPSKERFLQETLPLLLKTHKDDLKASLSSCSMYSLTIEEWKSDVCGTHVTFSVQFLDKSPENGLKRKVLSTIHSSLIYDYKSFSEVIEDILQEFGLSMENIRAVVCTTHDPVILSYLSFRGYTVVPCLLTTIQKVLTADCFSNRKVQDVLIKTRALLGQIYKNSKAAGSLQIQDELLQLDEIRLTSDYPDVWISTYSMLEELLKRRSIVGSILEAITISDEDKLLLTYTDEEWEIISEVIAVLEPFKVVLTTLAEEKSALVSIVKPLLNELLNVRLEVSKTDSEFAASLKNEIANSLREFYSDESVESLLKISTVLDPRLKTMVLTDDKKSNADLVGEVKKELIKVMDVIGCSNEDQEVGVAKKPRLSGMEILLRNVCVKNQPLSKADRADIEMMQYESEPPANLEGCPLAWWHNSANKYPYLSALSKEYNTIPATVLPQSWIPMEQSVAFYLKRARIPLDLVDPILFLHSNYVPSHC